MTQLSNSSNPDTRPKSFKNLFEECLFVFTIMMATASTTIIQGVFIVNTITIARDLHMSSAQMTWISAAIGLGSGSFMLLFGKTADLFGPKIQLLIGMIWLSSLFLISGFTQIPIIMNIICGLLGLGTAIIAPPSIGIIFALYPEGRRRNRVTGALGAGNPMGFILGSISSGVATKLYDWRASFFFIAFFFFILTLFSYWKLPAMPGTAITSKFLRNFDYLGTLLTIIGMALLTTGLTIGPQAGWKNYKTLTTTIMGVFCLFSFGIWEKFCLNPLLDPIIWKNQTYILCILCTAAGYMSFITNQFWISLYMQEVQNLSSLHISLRLLPQAIFGIIWSYIGQLLASRISGKIIMAIGSCAYLVGAILCYFIREDTSYWKILFPQLCITVIGADFQFIVSNLYITKQMPNQSSLAAGVLQTATRLSTAIGLPITTAFYEFVSNSDMNVDKKYEGVYLCSIVFAATSLLFVPFIHMEKQGEKSSDFFENQHTSEQPQYP